MRVISREALQALRERYPRGTRVELVQMDDPQAPPIGTKGTVIGVDDIGSIMVHWDNGSGLNVAYGVDVCRRVVKTGLETIKALDTTAGEIAEIISKGHPPFEEGGAVACDLVTCKQCWLAWLTTGKPPIPTKK